MLNYLFVYGTLIDKKVQEKVIGRKLSGIPNSLPGYKKSTVVIDNITYPILIPHQNGHIKGQVLELTEDELKKVDTYETDVYRRIGVNLSDGMKAWVYVK